jgi:hypothetical protein
VLTKQILGQLIALVIRTVTRKLLSTFLSLSLCGGGVALALDTPGTPPPANDAANEATRRIAAETTDAIEALGANPTTKQISTIVYKAVRSSPDNVLHIVDAAIRVSPQSAAPEIVTAATAGVPNPWKQVNYRRLEASKPKKSDPDFKGGPDYKSGPPASPVPSAIAGSNSQNAPHAGPADGKPMTLAEAIVQTAFDAQPGLSFSGLQAAANTALLTDPATLMRYIQSPNAVSGVGDAGLSNYANEPLRTPKQPVVSQ